MASCAWLVLIVAAPLLASSGPRRPLAVRLAATAYLAGSFVCHQRPARSFHLDGVQMPVCARCTGLYLAGAAGLLSGLAWLGRGGVCRAWSRAERFDWRLLLVLASMPLLVSVCGEMLGLWQGSNVWRAVSALPAGYAVGALVSESLSFQGRL